MKIFEKVILKTGEELILRTPQIEDAKEYTDYVNKLKRETNFITIDEHDDDYTVDSEIKFIQGYLNSLNSVCLFAELGGKIVGQASIGAISSKMKLKHRCGLGISVLKEYNGKGIAGKMMKKLIDLAKELNFEQIELGVIRENERAYQMYKSFGFVEQGVKRNAFKYKDNTYSDEIMMIKFIKE